MEKQAEYAVATVPNTAVVESVFIEGDLSKLTSEQRVSYYHAVCRSMGLNPLTKPFDFIRLNGRLVLYAKRDAADQLRKINGVSVSDPHIEYTDDLVIVTVSARDSTGRTDSDIGAVSIGNLRGEARANAIMKAITKAKRRVTLSIAGLGWLDETEIETVPSAQPVAVDTVTGEVVVSEEVTANKTEPPKAEPGNSEAKHLSPAALTSIRSALTRRNLSEAEACKIVGADSLEAFAGDATAFWAKVNAVQKETVNG